MTRMSQYRTPQRAWSLAVAAIMALWAAACSTGTEPSARHVASVGVTPANPNVVVGEEIALFARALDEYGEVVSGHTIIWSSTDTTIARVSSGGHVVAVAVGAVTIRATIDGKVGAAQLVVTTAPVVRVDVSPSVAAMEEGDTLSIIAVAKDAAGRPVSGRTIRWSSGNPTIATVDDSGRVTAKGIGTTRVSAAIEGKSAYAAITVTMATVASISILPTPLVIEVGEIRPLTAVARDARGNVLMDVPVTWTVDVANVRVSPSGVATGMKPGYATITATSGGKSFSAAATVSAGEPYGFDLLYHRRDAQNQAEIFVVSLGTGAAPTRINAGTVSSQPSASPNGARIAFAVSQFDEATQQQLDDIYAVDRNGMNLKRLTSMSGIDDQPEWSPDGARIAYRHSDPKARTDVWVMAADGSGAVNLTGDFPVTFKQSAPTWSPDGSRIAFASMQVGFAGMTFSIWTMRADGSDKRMLTSSSTGYDTSPTWSPDGERIAFIRTYGTDADITFVSANGGDPTRLPLVGRQMSPTWSADGRYIAFAQPGPVINLYTILPDGSQLRLRTVDPAWGGGSDPAWIRKPYSAARP